MASAYLIGSGGLAVAGVSGVGSRAVHPGAAVGKLRLPTDPQGTYQLTLSGLVVGSIVHVESVGGVSLLTITATSETEVMSLSAYAPGSPLNNLRIKVRKSSASPYYQPWETLATAIVGSQSIYVSQIPEE